MDSRVKMSKLTESTLAPKKISDYEPLVPEVLHSIESLVGNYKGLNIAHVNATAVGGGVAEMLQSVVPLQRDLGMNSHWYVIPPRADYFEVTKLIHNFLQGKEGELTQEQKAIYIEHNQLIASLLDEINADILIIHDPQPAAAISFMKKRPKLCIWRCHIDTSTPNDKVWQFLYPYLEKFDQFIFTTKEFAHQDIALEKINLLTPCIDPFATKNKLIDKNEAINILKSLGVDTTKPLITQVSRLDPWKDPKGVVDAFVLAQKQVPDLQLAFVANMASDDPEGAVIAAEIKEYCKDKSGIHFFINLADNDLQVNAFQTASNVIIQKSIREGFALTVTEAMWKGTVVIGGNVGGIKLQITDGKNGFLVNSPQEASKIIIYAINNTDKVKEMGQAAHEKVKNNFLLPHLILNELNLFKKSL